MTSFLIYGYDVHQETVPLLSVTDSAINFDGQLVATPEVKPKARPYGTRNPDAGIEARCQRLYRRQLDGLTPRQLVLEHSSRESVSVTTAWRDWRMVNAWVKEDWETHRDDLLPRLQNMRERLFHAALKRGQLQTCAQILDSLGKVVGESAPETISMSVPQLSVTISDKKND